MMPFFAVLVGSAVFAAQEPRPAAPRPTLPSAGKPDRPTGQLRFDSNGWPIVADAPGMPKDPPAAPAGEGRSPVELSASTPPPARDVAPVARPPASGGVAVPALASGMELGSPLLEVFQSVRTPGAFKSLGGVAVWWRLTVHGAQGEVIGMREVTHTADCAFADRDRLELPDGRVYGRSGPSVFAERGGMPWPTLGEQAGHDLGFFGLHWRLPWCFADSQAFAVVGRDVVQRSGERLARIVVERRTPGGLELVGPEAEPRPRDRFELVHEPGTGQLREFVHRLASSGQTRRVLLEDWRDVDFAGGRAARLPYRRVYVDENLRQTTSLEILRIESVQVTERDFRLR